MKQAKLLAEPEFKRLMAVINSLRYQTRNHTIIALSFYAGLRACEIAALSVGDVFDEAGGVKDTIYLNKLGRNIEITSCVFILLSLSVFGYVLLRLFNGI